MCTFVVVEIIWGCEYTQPFELLLIGEESWMAETALVNSKTSDPIIVPVIQSSIQKVIHGLHQPSQSRSHSETNKFMTELC